MGLSERIFGTRNDRVLNKYNRILQKINASESKFEAMSDEDLYNIRSIHKEMASKGPHEALLVDSFAFIREVSKRVLGLRHYDVQIIGGLVLNDGKVAEMRTGEGKTLVSTLPSYYNSLFGSVHVVTANDYLAERDANILRPLYDFIGMTISSVTNNADHDTRKRAYKSDILYSTSSELGFDYLRDHTAMDPTECVQKRELNFVIVDELDSVLIDEARTPLVISGQTEVKPEDYIVALDLAKHYETIKRVDFDEQDLKEKTHSYHAIVDEQKRTIEITEKGFELAENYFIDNMLLKDRKSMYSQDGLRWMQVLRVMLIAMKFYQRDVDYLVSEEGEIQIIDESTGRIMKGRRWNDGIHQCIETIEGVQVRPESINLASITIQNFFKLYRTLSGMTGTADTEAMELNKTYGLDVVVIPTNKPVIRIDERDKLFTSLTAKMKFLMKDIIRSNEQGQPVLIGTENVQMSEFISNQLNQHGIRHEVLNAKKHMKEASIIAQAGRPGAITIATNMAGRGTDIILGGNPEALVEMLPEPSEIEIKAVYKKCKEDQQKVINSGGLRVIGTGRHQTRRIDNQLIGRAGRQGDPGSSIFYLSLDDDLLSKFVHPKQRALIRSLGLKDDDFISGNMINKNVRKAQQMIEQMFYDMRKNMLEFDNVINEQRRVIYTIRDNTLHQEDFFAVIYESIDDLVEELIKKYADSTTTNDNWKIEEMERDIAERFAIHLSISDNPELKTMNFLEFKDRLSKSFKSITHHFVQIFGEEFMTTLARQILLTSIDQNWRDHTELMGSLLEGIHLRGYAQKDPRQEYKREAFELFMSMRENMNNQFLQLFFLNANQMIHDELSKDEVSMVSIN